MSSVDKSPKLVFNEFQKSISEVPLEVFYQTLTADQYNVNGFQFNIKQPGHRALLDTDIWIKYKIPLEETAAGGIRNALEGGIAGNDLPTHENRICLRGGYAVWRTLQNFNVQINNQTLSVQPYKYVDILNRLYVSNEQAEHEFSTSGGQFDSGNHSTRDEHIRYQVYNVADGYASVNVVPNGWGNAQGGAINNAAGANTSLDVYIIPTWFRNGNARTNVNQDLVTNIRPPYPLMYEFYNKGFSDKVNQMVMKLRDLSAEADVNNIAGLSFIPRDGGVAAANTYWWNLTVYERLPISLFKMYSNDGVFGVIPNVVQMQIQGNFLTNFQVNLFRSNNAAIEAKVNFDRNTNPADCELYLRWYTPPMNMVIPRELSVPYPKFCTWSTAVTLTPQLLNANLYAEGQTSTYNVTLESIPDLLLIYIKYSPAEYTYKFPDDYLMEIYKLQISIDCASGKMNQMLTLDLYNKWKRILKHNDSKILGYDEWRKYCCVAALQPDDYGVRYGPGYSNQTTLGIEMTYRNWWNIPAINYVGNQLYNGRSGQLCVTSIYNRNRLIIRADGTAAQEMVKVAADFNVINSMSQANEVLESRGRLNL